MSVNPYPRQHRFFYDMHAASDAGEHHHPQSVVRGLAHTHGFKVLDAVPQSLFDGWDFWIETVDDGPAPVITPYFKAAAWKPIGEP